jgi:hypothetical protein
MLADILGRIGSVGTAHEHFPTAPDAPLPDWMARCRSFEEIFPLLEEDAAPSRYFGIKGGIFQMFPLISSGVFAGPRCIFKHIYLTRRDRIAQAISLARAIKTNEWHSSDPVMRDPDLSFEEVLYFLRYLRTMEADWETVFSALQLDPLRLCYEDLIDDRQRVFEQIREHLGVQWKTDPCHIISAHESISARHDRGWLRRLYSQFETDPLR